MEFLLSTILNAHALPLPEWGTGGSEQSLVTSVLLQAGQTPSCRTYIEFRGHTCCSQRSRVTQRESIDSGCGSRLHMALNFTHQARWEILPPIVFGLDCIAFLITNWVCCILTVFQMETLRDENLHFVIAIK